MASKSLGDPKSKQPSDTTIPPSAIQYGAYEGSQFKLKINHFIPVANNQVFCVRFDQEDQLLAAGCSNGNIKLFDLQAGKLLKNDLGAASEFSQSPTTSLRWRPTVICKTKQVLVSVNSDGTISHWHALSGKQLHSIVEQNNSILCMDYNSDGSQFVTSGKDFHVRIYDEDTKSVVIDFSPADWNNPGHGNRVFAAKFLQNDNNILLSGGWDSNVKIWDLRERKSVASIYGPNISGDSLDCKDGLILTGSYRNVDQLQLWDFKTRKLFKQITWNNNSLSENQAYVYAAQFSKVGTSTFAAGSYGINQLVVHNAANDFKPCSSLLNLSEGVYGIDYANRSSKLAFGGAGGLYVLSLYSP